MLTNTSYKFSFWYNTPSVVQATQLPSVGIHLSSEVGLCVEGVERATVRLLASSSSIGMSWTPTVNIGFRREGSVARRSVTAMGIFERTEIS